jgi:hypothetical protein
MIGLDERLGVEADAVEVGPRGRPGGPLGQLAGVVLGIQWPAMTAAAYPSLARAHAAA